MARIRRALAAVAVSAAIVVPAADVAGAASPPSVTFSPTTNLPIGEVSHVTVVAEGLLPGESIGIEQCSDLGLDGFICIVPSDGLHSTDELGRLNVRVSVSYDFAAEFGDDEYPLDFCDNDALLARRCTLRSLYYSGEDMGTVIAEVDLYFTAGGPAAPRTREDCMNGGWMRYPALGFRNQGLCIKYVNTGR